MSREAEHGVKFRRMGNGAGLEVDFPDRHLPGFDRKAQALLAFKHSGNG
jgi:hypothetical protein